jgi:hypothetical protein
MVASSSLTKIFPQSRVSSWRIVRAGICLLLLLVKSPANAGEIPGLPSSLLPTVDRDFAINFSNDFLGRGGSVDDFRTQQIIISAKINDKWMALLDHSIQTLTDSPVPGRTDQLSASLGYQLMDTGGNTVLVGGGIRSVGEYAGERMQNGFHRLIGSNIDSLPYVTTDETDFTVWLDANRQRELRKFGNWQSGYWLRGASLATTGGQWDSTISAMATLSKNSIDIWAGLRHDWRSGYDTDAVQMATAYAEEDSAFVFGVRFGALMLETVQQLNNDASYGQLVLVSSGARAENLYLDSPEYGIEFGFLVPDVEFQLAGKKRTSLLVNESSTWCESALIDVRYGKPQYENDDSLYIETLQLSAGLEWERPLITGQNWLSFYGSLGGGWRSEQLYRDDLSISEKSSTEGKAVLTGAAGIRFFATTMGAKWSYRLQLGLSAVVPISDESVQLGLEQFTLHEPRLGISLGMTFDHN